MNEHEKMYHIRQLKSKARMVTSKTVRNPMYIHIKVKTGMNKETVSKLSDDHFEIAVKEPAKRNMANRRILEIMGKLYPNSPVKIINGHNSPSKLLSIGDSE